VGSQLVTITVEGRATAFTVTVKPLLSISVANPPLKLLYKKGESLDLTGLSVRGTWDVLGSGTIPVTDVHISGYDANILGQQTVTITVEGKSAAFTVTVRVLSSIEVAKVPDKIIYETGENLDLTGIEVVGTYSNLSTGKIPVTFSNVTGYNKTKSGEQTLVVTIDDKIATFTVTVRALSSIEIRSGPNKTVYELGESLDVSGLVVVGTYTDASKKIIATDTSNISGYDNTKAGEQTIMVTVQGKMVVFPITVLPPSGSL
jgi:hypothetical protein